jgi:hypothetical protein
MRVIIQVARHVQAASPFSLYVVVLCLWCLDSSMNLSRDVDLGNNPQSSRVESADIYKRDIHN